MRENRQKNPAGQLVAWVICACWIVFVMVRFYREHPVGLRNAWRLALGFRVPPPTDLLKILAIGKHTLLICVLILVGMLAGRRLLRLAGVAHCDEASPGKWETGLDLMLALGLGWGLLMYVTLAIGFAGVLYPTAIWIVISLGFLVCIRDIPATLRDIKSLFLPETDEEASAIVRIGWVLTGITLLFLAAIALAPSITHDAMVYHLNVPRIFANEHRILTIPYNLFANTVLNMEMLYAAALLIDDFILANLIHFTFGIATLIVLFGFARRHLGAHGAIITVLIFFFNPTVLGEMSIAYVDIAMTFYFLLAVVCLWKWKTGGSSRWFILMSVFAGIFAGIKYTSLYGLVALAVTTAAAACASGERRIAGAIGRLAAFGAIVGLFVAPYLLKNYVITGNPVYPVMYDIFKGQWLLPHQVERMLAFVESHGMGHDWRNLLLLPWNITIFGKSGSFETFDATITPLWLMFLPALILVRPLPSIAKWSLVICAAYFLSWAASTHITRYLMPTFPLLSLLCAHTLVGLGERSGRISSRLSTAFKVATVGVCGLVWFSFSHFYFLRVPSEFGPVLWGSETRDEFLTEKVLHYAVFKYINDNLPADARIAFFWDNRGFFCERSKIGDTVIEAPLMIELVHEAGSPDAVHEAFRSKGVTHIFDNELFHMKLPVYTISKEDDARLAADIKIFRLFLEQYCTPLFTADWATLYEIND